jgi:hypothetical protein
VVFLGEGGLAGPGDAFATHLAEAVGAAVHPDGQGVAADAAEGAGAVDDFRGAVVRAAGAEIGAAQGGDFGFGDRVEVVAQAGGVGLQLFAVGVAGDAGGDGERDFGAGEFAVRLQHGGAVGVALAEDAGAIRRVVEDVADLLLDEGVLFLDDDDFFEAPGEFADGFGVDGPGEGELEEANAGGFRQAEIGEGLAGVVVALAGGDDAEAGADGVEDGAVQPVGAGVALGFRQADGDGAGFLLQRQDGDTAADVAEAQAGIGVRAVGQDDAEIRQVEGDGGG